MFHSYGCWVSVKNNCYKGKNQVSLKTKVILRTVKKYMESSVIFDRKPKAENNQSRFK